MKLIPKSIPKLFALPGDYAISVRTLGDDLANKEMGADAYAMWDVDERTIYLRKSRAATARREDFIHECEHALIDWKDWFLGKSKEDES